MSYIEREAVLKIIGDNCPYDKGGYNTEEEMGAGAACYYIMKDVENIPDADVEKVMHGHWILEKEPNGNPYCFHCSVCDDEFRRIDIKTKTPYCPYCGARMDEEGDKQ